MNKNDEKWRKTLVHGPCGRGFPPETPPTSRRGPYVSPLPLPGAGTGFVRFDEVLPLRPQDLPIRFSPWATCWACYPVGPVVESVADQLRALDLLSSFMDPPEVEALRARLVPPLSLLLLSPSSHPTGRSRKSWRTSANDRVPSQVCCCSFGGYSASSVLCWLVLTGHLPADGHAADLATDGDEEVGLVRVEHSAPAVMPGFGGGWAWWGRWKSPTEQKNSCTPRKTWYFGDSVSTTCLEETEGIITVSIVLTPRQWVCVRMMRLMFLGKTGLGLARAICGMRRPTSQDCAWLLN